MADRRRTDPPSSRAFAFSLDVDFWGHTLGARRLGASVFDFSVVKSIGSPSGQWSVTYDRSKGGLDPLDVEDDDWLALSIREQYSRKRSLLMFGAVDGARRAVKTDDRTASTARAGKLSGRDFGKAFEVHDVLHDSHLQLAEPVLPGLIDVDKFSALMDLIHNGQLQAPATTFFDLLSLLIASDVGWYYLPKAFGRRSLSDVLAVQSDVIQGNVIQLGTYVPDGAQKLDPYLRSIFATPFTEFFYDLRTFSESTNKLDLSPTAGAYFGAFGVVPTVVFRRVPFFELEGSDAWLNLERHRVDPSEVLDEDIGRSGAERYTLFSVRAPPFAPTATLGAWGASGGKVPAFEHHRTEDSPIRGRPLAGDVARHGVRLLDVSDALAPISGTNGPTGEKILPPEWIAERTAGLYRLYRNSPGTVSGTIKLAHLRPEIRIGHALIYDDREYYIDQVEHSGRVDSRTGLVVGETSLTVVRGQTINPIPVGISPTPWRGGTVK